MTIVHILLFIVIYGKDVKFLIRLPTHNHNLAIIISQNSPKSQYHDRFWTRTTLATCFVVEEYNFIIIDVWICVWNSPPYVAIFVVE